MSDGHLVFTANGANAAGQPTVYWFAINSNVGLPKEPWEEPKEPTAPTPPTPEVPEQAVHAQPQTPVLPNTGTESSTAAVLAGAIAGLLARKKKED